MVVVVAWTVLEVALEQSHAPAAAETVKFLKEHGRYFPYFAFLEWENTKSLVLIVSMCIHTIMAPLNEPRARIVGATLFDRCSNQCRNVVISGICF